jgi:hypothetical protein
MTKTQNTTEAAKAANVTTKTIRTWCRNGSVSATKVNNRWAINTDSLNTHLAARIARHADRIITFADFAPYKDEAKARDGVMNLLQDGSVVPLVPGLYQVASKSNDNVYLVSAIDQTCDCKAHVRSTGKGFGYCTHLTTVNAIEASKGNARLALTLVAA